MTTKPVPAAKTGAAVTTEAAGVTARAILGEMVLCLVGFGRGKGSQSRPPGRGRMEKRI